MGIQVSGEGHHLLKTKLYDTFLQMGPLRSIADQHESEGYGRKCMYLRQSRKQEVEVLFLSQTGDGNEQQLFILCIGTPAREYFLFAP